MDTSPAEKVVLTVLAGIPDDPELGALGDAYVAEFNASHANIEVKRELIDVDQMRTIMQTRLGSGEIDIFPSDPGPGFGGVLAKAGLLADMSPYYEKYGWPIFDWAKARCTYNGVVSCIPSEVEELGIFYNTTLFDEYGLTVPEDLAEFMEVMDTFKANGITPLAFGNQPQWPAGHQFSMTLSNIVGRDGLDARLYGEAPWNDADTVRAIDIFFRQFQDNGYFPKDPNAITYEDANALFYAGKAAMLPSGTWLVAEIMNLSGDAFETGFFPFPSIDGSGVHPPSGIGVGSFIAANSQHKDAAAEFLNWGLQPEQIRKWGLETFSVIPAMPVDTNDLEISPLFAKVLEDLAETSGTTPDFGYNIDVLAPANFNDEMFAGFQEVLNDRVTPQELADRLQAAYQEAISQGDTIEKP